LGWPTDTSSRPLGDAVAILECGVVAVKCGGRDSGPRTVDQCLLRRAADPLPLIQAMIEITITGFCQPMRAPQGVITPPLPKAMRDKYFVRMYSPAEVKKWQFDAKKLAIEQMNGKPPLKGMLDVSIDVYLPVPKSMSAQKTRLALEGLLRPITRPDADNYSKSVCDSMTGVLWCDDAQIVSLHVNKWYSQKPRVIVQVGEMPYPLNPVQDKETFPLFR